MNTLHKLSRTWLVAGSLAIVGIVSPSLGQANALAIAPTQATFHFNPAIAPWLNQLGVGVQSTGFKTGAPGVLSSLIDNISVAGQGPGPIRIEWPQEMGFQLDLGPYSAAFSGLALDVGTRALTADLSVSFPMTCAPGLMCPAVMQTAQWADVPLLWAHPVVGNIDGGMPLDQAQAVPTFAPMQVNMTTGLYLHTGLLSHLVKPIGLTVPSTFVPMGYLTLSPAAVPEPGAVVLTAMGVLVLMVSRRRKAV